ncbi:uridine kinase family protein [Actinocatenispora rupis]|uniref:Uridine kinase n=1 Tax=Actinocatenispora rupis TaxID=519421 RepID=A0A8J3NA55_9ACTN|nr:ATP-binding protein [Actinocatenispora rupis]GID11751.1 hypothetical protein Aru02nite_26400 [Actinocatenispora rupis]
MRARGDIARVILLAGPSGSGKSYVARHSGLPVLPLDDFYLNGDDPRLPRVGDEHDVVSPKPGGPGTEHNPVDWESPASWDATAAVAAIELLARTGSVEVPHYDISVDRCTGYERLTLGDAPVFVAEGIFAAEIVAACRDRGVLGAAYALRRPRSVTFVRRLVRDLREHRKPPATLLRRGIRLFRAESRILARQSALGCRSASAGAIRRAIARAATGSAERQTALS